MPSSKVDPIEPAEGQYRNNLTAVSSYLGLRSLVSGAVGGLCSVIVGYPFDLVKVRRQTAKKSFYTSSVDTIRKAVIKDGLAKVLRVKQTSSWDSRLIIYKQGLYAGVSIPLIGVTPMCILPLYRLALDLVDSSRCCFLLGLRPGEINSAPILL